MHGWWIADVDNVVRGRDGVRTMKMIMRAGKMIVIVIVIMMVVVREETWVRKFDHRLFAWWGYW